jgi:amidohydrolase
MVARAHAETLPAAVQAALPSTHDAYVFLHQNPELGKKEFKAHNYIAARLKALGYTDITTSPSAPTAVIAVLETGRPGPTIALRAEMDARPLPAGVDEPAGHSPRSQVSGVMHNCGHDVHAAILLGLAQVLQTHHSRFGGKIVLVFQPAEETPGGADDIVADKVLDKLGVQQIYAEHSAPGLPVGTVAVAPGDTLAGSNYFTLTLSGKGSHAAAPYEGNDVALAAMKVAEAISELPARGLDIANRPAVISITRFVADSGASNVVPSTAQIAGTIRAFEDLSKGPDGAPSIAALVEDRVDKLSAAYGLKAEFTLRAGSPPTRNDPALFGAIAPKLSAAFPGKVDTTPGRGMFSEDFAYYTPHYKALYFSLGVAKDGLGQGGVHTVDFTVHPDALVEGLTLMTMLAELGTTGAVGWR